MRSNTLAALREVLAGPRLQRAASVVGGLGRAKRQSNREIIEAVDDACRQMNGWGLGAFEVQRWVGKLPKGATRYYVDQECVLTGTLRRRAAVKQLDGRRYYEVELMHRDGVHYRPTVHFHHDMCGGSWYSSVCAVHTTMRGTVFLDRFHRILCDVDEAINDAGLMITRLEMAAANAMRRKPWAKEGNHRILVACAQELFSISNPDSEVFDLHYEEICDDLDIPQYQWGLAETRQHVFEQSKEKMIGATIDDEEKPVAGGPLKKAIGQRRKPVEW